jgi:hypothetical protein
VGGFVLEREKKGISANISANRFIFAMTKNKIKFGDFLGLKETYLTQVITLSNLQQYSLIMYFIPTNKHFLVIVFTNFFV